VLEELEIINCLELKKVITSHNQKLTQEEKNYVGEGKERKYKVSKEIEPTLEKLTITSYPKVKELSLLFG